MMKTVKPKSLSIVTSGVATLLLAGAAAAQTPDSPSSRLDPDMSTAATARPKEGREAKMSGITAGSIVQSPAGDDIGRVKDIVPDSNTGEPSYIVISTKSGTAAVPYATIAPRYQSGHVVLDRGRLESAPRVRESALKDKKDASWMKESDRYWESGNPAKLR